MTPHEKLLAIVDAADPANVGCPPGTCAICDDRLAARPDWLAARRLAEAVPETVDALKMLEGDEFTLRLMSLSPQSLIQLTRNKVWFTSMQWARLATELANRLERTGAPPTEEE